MRISFSILPSLSTHGQLSIRIHLLVISSRAIPSLHVQHFPEPSGVGVPWQVELELATSEQVGVQEHIPYTSSSKIKMVKVKITLYIVFCTKQLFPKLKADIVESNIFKLAYCILQKSYKVDCGALSLITSIDLLMWSSSIKMKTGEKLQQKVQSNLTDYLMIYFIQLSNDSLSEQVGAVPTVELDS